MNMKSLIGAIAAATLTTQAPAVITVTNTVGGTAATYSNTAAASNTGTAIADANFTTDAGAPDHVFDNAWFWRLGGDTREFQFSAAGAVDASAANVGTRTYASQAGGAFSAVITFTLLDGPVAGQALLAQSMTVTNLSAAPLTMSLYNYLDADVGGTFGGDSATLLGADTMNIVDGANFVQFQGVAANAYQVTAFQTLGALLTNTAVNNLNNTGLPFGPGDFTGAFQWDLQLGLGGSATVVEFISVNMAVPAPGALALLGLAGLVSGRRRRH